MSNALTVVNQHLQFPPVTLIEQTTSVYLHIAAEVDKRLAFLPDSRAKKQAIAGCKRWCAQLATEPGVVDASVFTAILVPPIPEDFLAKRRDSVHVARFDFSVLIECRNKEVLDGLRRLPTYTEMENTIRSAASYVHIVSATNARHIGPVDHARQGTFLFNYFYADSVVQNLEVWNYTAGWFQAETGLDNSTVLLPDEPSQSQYAIINHCRWDRLLDILPSLIFKKSFHSYVLDNFVANDVAAMPILYHLA